MKQVQQLLLNLEQIYDTVIRPAEVELTQIIISGRTARAAFILEDIYPCYQKLTTLRRHLEILSDTAIPLEYLNTSRNKYPSVRCQSTRSWKVSAPTSGHEPSIKHSLNYYCNKT